MFGDLAGSIEGGGLRRFLQQLKKADILVLDDWGLTSVNTTEARYLLEVVEDRIGERSTIIAAQLPVSKWHELFEDSTVADAILDRLIHNVHRFELQGPSLRRQMTDIFQVDN